MKLSLSLLLVLLSGCQTTCDCDDVVQELNQLKIKFYNQCPKVDYN